MIEKSAYKRLEAVPFNQVTITDRFWFSKLKAHKNVTLPVCIDQCEITGRIDNFKKAANLKQGGFEGAFYNDSDVYKVIEGAAYSLMNSPDEVLEVKVDQIIDIIASAQQSDGYLFTYYQLNDPNQKWTDMDKHEMYCGGHLIEAAIAYKRATGKIKLFEVACRVADHFNDTFGPGKRHWVPGHPEIEIALIQLFQETKEERYWKLALWLLEERGHGHGEGGIWNKQDWGPSYCQDDKPVRQLERVTGHAVRAMYLYTAMADVAGITGDKEYLQALDRLWDNVVMKNMYITGGIGPSKHNEGFTEDYDLPNETAYCETCASVGMVLWNHRMNLLHGNAKYADVMERAMYNGALSGVSLRGDKFFYVNPLASRGKHHRVRWFTTSCCPTQMARFIPSIGNYIYAKNEKDIMVNLFIEGKATFKLGTDMVTLTQFTNYPWDGTVDIAVQTRSSNPFSICLRYPGWCKSATILVNGKQVSMKVLDGYIRLEHKWRDGDRVTFVMDMPAEIIHSHPLVEENKGRVAVQRGPLVYCLEQTDNHGDLFEKKLVKEEQFLLNHHPSLLDGITVLNTIKNQALTFFPYFAWDNREEGTMVVWIKEGV
ncbi:glycoside hydrolase family 127 protein [Bacillus infantis]|uniref:glycoside hydrolase family 127 protein n=1 Tax=Bacillus infantis TaxID=324767 RepID=UPI00209EF6DD|nr:beta-L-arabinofuranosidase domain-containing protein [Bacillus infantis]MCP1160663.1 glycoside hydrolase family 127 protein [Bacillus infantis]